MSTPTYLENRRSGRFWSLERQGSRITTRFGALGKPGAARQRELPDAQQALQVERQAVARRLAHGYRRVEPAGATLAELEQQLARVPFDEEHSLIWADLLLGSEDPRGEYVALEHCIRSASAPRAALTQSRRQAELVARYRSAMWQRPGGFPFRPRWRGRRYVGFTSNWSHKLRGKAGRPLARRLMRFVDRLTDLDRPSGITFGGLTSWVAYGQRLAPPAAEELQLATRILGPGEVNDRGHFVPRPDGPPPAAGAIDELVSASPKLVLCYRFRLAWPGTKIPLPHQEGEHYAGGQPLESVIAVELSSRDATIALQFPFEDFEPRFLAYFEQVEQLLGRCFSRNHFGLWMPKKGGKEMKAKTRVFDPRRFDGQPIPHED